MTMSSCAGTHAMAMRQPLSFDGVHNFLDTLFGDDLTPSGFLARGHAGAIQSASLAVGLIGQGLALRAVGDEMRSSRWTDCCPTRASTSMTCWGIGVALAVGNETEQSRCGDGLDRAPWSLVR